MSSGQRSVRVLKLALYEEVPVVVWRGERRVDDTGGYVAPRTYAPAAPAPVRRGLFPRMRGR